jgi:hypothetical protein
VDVERQVRRLREGGVAVTILNFASVLIAGAVVSLGVLALACTDESWQELTSRMARLADLIQGFSGRGSAAAAPGRGATLEADYMDLLAHARAAVAAARDGETDPCGYLVDALEPHGQLPPDGMHPAQILALPRSAVHRVIVQHGIARIQEVRRG